MRRLVAKHVGQSVRDVASVIEAPVQQPGDDEVLLSMTHVGINGGCETFRARGEFACAPPRAACIHTRVATVNPQQVINSNTSST